MEENAIVLSGESTLVPAMHYAEAQRAYQAMKEFVTSVMKEGTDYGVIPGTEKKDGKPDKKTLFKPGAEKLARFFGLSVRFEITKEIEQWDDENAFFYYRHKCILSRISDGAIIAEGEGSCNSHEKKYRWRNAERICPSCGQPAIIKGKEEFGGGWLCWKKNGGCGAKFQDGNREIESQEVGKIENPDIADVANTVLKQSKKRAFVDGVLLASNASEYFTQDVEDLDYGVQVVTVVPETEHQTATPPYEPGEIGPSGEQLPPKKSGKRPMSPEDLQAFVKSQLVDAESPICDKEKAKKFAIKWNNILHQREDERHIVASFILGRKTVVGSFKELTDAEIDLLQNRWLLSNPPAARQEAQSIIDFWVASQDAASVSDEQPEEAEPVGQSTLAAFFGEGGPSDAYRGQMGEVAK